MASSLQNSEFLTARQFGEALIAGLAVAGQQRISASQTQLHRAFKKVLSELEANPALKVDLSEVDYDPLYGLSGWLDAFLARAQRDLLISSPNPSYERIDIKVTPKEGEERLSRYKNGDFLKDLSSTFVNELRP